MSTRTCIMGLIIGVVLFSLTMPFAAAEPLPRIVVKDAQQGAPIDNLNLSVGQEKVLRLEAEVPAGKILKAYSLEISVKGDPVRLIGAAKAPGAAFAPLNITTKAGQILANAFDIQGVEGPALLSFVDFRLSGTRAGQDALRIRFVDYGTSNDQQFRPEPLVLKVDVR